ncbi:MAG: DUF1624 domain-containing protein [Asgard group archaeon]|nr:DUF1624 domain-containing protein [Asgard group archaeon]
MTVDNNLIEDQQPKKERFLSIDVFRGFAVLAMMFVNTLAEFSTTPSWTKHAEDFGLTYVDLVAPFFILAIALTYKMSFNSSLRKEGRIRTYTKFIRRYGAFLGFGFLGSILIAPTGIDFGWGVLQAIGFAGIFTTFFIEIPKLFRLITALIFMIAYQFIIGLPVTIDGTIITISDLGFNDSHGGFIGGFGYGIMLLLATSIVDDFRETNKWELLIQGGLLTAIGTGLHFLWLGYGFPAYGGISKLRVTESYIMLSIGLGLLIYWLMWFLYDKKKFTKGKSYILEPNGRNAFFLYIIQPIFIGLSILYLKNDSHFALVVFSAFLNVALVWVIAYLMDKKKVYIII